MGILMMTEGWVRSIRKSKSITFCSCTNGTTEFQITIKDGIPIEGDLKVGCSFTAAGEDSTTPRGLYEFLVQSLKVIGPSDDDFPIQPKEHSDEFLREIPESRGRALKYANYWKVRSQGVQALHRFLSQQGYINYQTPIITHADCEGAGETFKVSSDWMNADLTVSGQLQLEVGMMSLGRVYTFSPCFRAEKSMTRKHLAEFWMLEVETAFTDLNSTIDLCESTVKSIITSIDKEGKKVTLSPWRRLAYDAACHEFGIPYGTDIGSETEKAITDKYGPTFVTHYPKELKPFYMRKNEKTAACFDLLFPVVGELAGGSEREENHDKLKAAMEASGMDIEKMQWYLNTRKWGTVPHAGFGIGFERLIMFLTDAQKVHDVIPFPNSY